MSVPYLLQMRDIGCTTDWQTYAGSQLPARTNYLINGSHMCSLNILHLLFTCKSLAASSSAIPTCFSLFGHLELPRSLSVLIRQRPVALLRDCTDIPQEGEESPTKFFLQAVTIAPGVNQDLSIFTNSPVLASNVFIIPF